MIICSGGFGIHFEGVGQCACLFSDENCTAKSLAQLKLMLCFLYKECLVSLGGRIIIGNRDIFTTEKYKDYNLFHK